MIFCVLVTVLFSFRFQFEASMQSWSAALVIGDAGVGG
jgi:hypothetical protein